MELRETKAGALLPSLDPAMIWKCAGQRFDNWEDYIRFYYAAMPNTADWLIADKCQRQPACGKRETND